MKNLNNLSINEKETYALVTKEGKIIARFRLISTALQMKHIYENRLIKELEIKKVK